MARLSLLGPLILALGTGVSGCHRPSGPDPRFERAEAAFTAALAEQGEDAYQDPRADEALAAARAVAKESIDRDAADALVRRIEGERRHEAAEAAKLAAMAAPLPDPEGDAPAVATRPSARPDAGTPAPKPPVVGSSEADFQQRYAGCVQLLAPFVEHGGKREGKAFSLVPGACEERFPELRGLAVAVLGGKVFNVVPASTFHVDAPDAGTPHP